MSSVTLSSISNLSGTSAITVDKITPGFGYYSQRAITQVDTTSRTSTTTWTLGPTFETITNFLPSSQILLTYYVPMRNDSTSWGGGYIEPQVSFNGGTWQSLGSSGYDGGVMRLGQSSIASYYQTILIDPGLSSAFSTQFRFYFRSYDGTVGWNNGVNHDINVVSGTATIMSGNNGLQHFMHIVVEELARFAL
jgi:hypothetical protein